MTVQVAVRLEQVRGAQPVKKRAVLVGCDAPLCEKALEVPVNLQASNAQCINDTIRMLTKKSPNGWTVSVRKAAAPKFWCAAHRKDEGKTSTRLWVPGT